MSETTSKLKKKKTSPCPSTNLVLKKKPTTPSRRNPLKDLNTTTTITKTRSNTRTFNYTSTSSSSSSNASSSLNSSLSIDSPKCCLRLFLPNTKNPPFKSSKRTPNSAPISKPRFKPPISNKPQRTPFLNKSQNDKDSNIGNFEHNPNLKSSVDLNECGSESLQWSFSRILIEGNCDDDRTPVVSKKECRSGLDEKEVTPPVQASISPEIQCGSSFTSDKSTCFGAGHVLSGIPDKRKCKARGILAVEEEKELGLFNDCFSIDDKSFQGFFDNSRLSLIPAPIDASMHWLSPPRNEEENDYQKESFQNGSTPFPSPSSSSSYGHGFSTDICNSNSTSNTTSTAGKSVCLVSPNAHLDFGLWRSEAEMSNEKRGYQYKTPDTKISPSSAGDCACLVSPSAGGDFEGRLGLKALMANGEIEQKISPSSGGDSLGSYNAVCTPQSDSSLEDCVAGLSWLKNANCHAKPSLSPKNHTSMCDPADVLPLPGFSFQFTHPTRPSTLLQKTSNDWSLGISSASCGSSLQSQMRISWRDGVVSRIFEMDDLDCCRLLSDDEEEDISCKNGANVVKNGGVPNEPVSEPLESDMKQCNVHVFEKFNTCAESIHAEGDLRSRKHQQQTMSKPWGGAGAWAADSERADAEESERLAANPVVESQSFPSLKESLGAKPKKKNKGITLSLSEFSSGAYAAPKRDHSLDSSSKGLTHDEMIRLPTGPRERSAEEMEVGRLGGGFKNYGGGGGGGRSMGGRRSDDSGDGSWGGRKSNGGFDNDRRSERAPSRDSDLPSRADEVDNWAVGKKSLSRIDSGRDNRYGSGDNGRQDKYSSLGGGSRADEVDNWGTGKKSLPVRSNNSSFGSGFRDPLAMEADRWTRTGPLPPREGDRERPRLNLDPPRGNGTLNEADDRERPRLVLNPPSGNGSLTEAPKSTRPSPFGVARPREDVLAEKGVDVKKLDSDIETKKSSRSTSPHSSRPSSSHSNGHPENPAPLVLEEVPKPRPKVNPFGDAKPREVLLQEKGLDWRKNDVELEHRSVEAKVWRKNDVELENPSVEAKDWWKNDFELEQRSVEV